MDISALRRLEGIRIEGSGVQMPTTDRNAGYRRISPSGIPRTQLAGPSGTTTSSSDTLEYVTDLESLDTPERRAASINRSFDDGDHDPAILRGLISALSTRLQQSTAAIDNFLGQYPEIVLMQIPSDALVLLKSVLKEGEFLEAVELDDGQVLIAYADDMETWDKITSTCAIHPFPKKHAIKLSLSTVNGKVELSLSFQVSATGAATALVLGGVVAIALGYFRFPYYAVYHHSVAIAGAAGERIEAGIRITWFSLLAIVFFPLQIIEFICTAPTRLHQMINRILQDLLLWALRYLSEDLQEAPDAHLTVAQD